MRAVQGTDRQQIEQKERQIASNKLASTTQNKGDAVKAILDELERVTDQ